MSITDNTSLMMGIKLKWRVKGETGERNKGETYLFVDYEKAFDSLSWNFIFETLKRLNLE